MPSYTLYYFNGRGRAEILRMMFNAAGVKYMDKRFDFNEWDKYRSQMPSMCVPVLEIDGKQKMPETMAIGRYLAREFGFFPKSSLDMMRCDYICDCFYEIMHDYMRFFHSKNGRFRSSANMPSSGVPSSGRVTSGISSGGLPASGMPSSGKAGMPTGGMMPSGMKVSGSSSMGTSGLMGSKMGSDMVNPGMTSGKMTGDMSGSSYDNYMYCRYMNTFNRIMPFMERTLCMRNGGSSFFMGDQMMWCDMMMYCCLESMYMQNKAMFSQYPKLMALYTRVAQHPKVSSYLKSRCNSTW